MSGAVTSSPRSGPAAPAAIGTPSRPASAATRRAFSVASSSGQLPATVVTASRSIASLPAASSSATASSWPGSQSSRIGVAIPANDTSRLGDDLDRAAVVGSEARLDRHVQVAQRLEVVRQRQRPGVDRAQPAVGRHLLHGALGLLVVGGEEDVERLAGDLAL